MQYKYRMTKSFNSYSFHIVIYRICRSRLPLAVGEFVFLPLIFKYLNTGSTLVKIFQYDFPFIFLIL
jgi:hypothetical protein